MSEAPPPLPTAPASESQWSIAVRQFRRNRPAVWGFRITVLLGLLAVYAPLLACQIPLVWREPGRGIELPWFARLFDEIVWEHGIDRFFNAILVATTLWIPVGVAYALTGRAPGVRRGLARFTRWYALAALLVGLVLASGWDAVTSSRPTVDYTRDPHYLEQHANQALDWTQERLRGSPVESLAAPALASRRPDDLERARAGILAWTEGRGVTESSDPLDAAAAIERASSALRRAAAERERERAGEGVWLVLRTPIPYGYRDQREGREEWFRPAFDRVSGHLLGSDLQGRDVLARLLYGTRISLTIGLVAVAIYVTIGTFLGAIAGYFGRRTDLLIMRIVEVVICIPPLFLIMMIVALTANRSIFLIMVAIGLVGWTSICRLVRGQFLRERAMDYVTAARAAGLPTRRIIFRHVLPNAFAPVLVAATFGVASAILTESTLAFIGLGDITVPSWGRTLDDGRVDGYLHLILPPTFAIFITVTALNLVGDGVRDALDPKLRN